MKRSTVLGVVLVLLSALFFAVSGPFAKTLYAIGWSPGAFVTIRAVLCALVLLVPTLLLMRGRWAEARRHWKSIVLYGAVAMTGAQALYFMSLDLQSVAVSVLLVVMGAPLIIVFLVWARTGVRPAPVTLAGVVLSLLGVALVLDLRGASMSWPGVLMSLGAAVCFSVYFMISSDLEVRIPSVAFTGLGMAVGAVVAVIATLTPLFPAEVVLADVDLLGAQVSWAVPLALVVAFTIGAFVFALLGVRFLGATVGSFVNLTEVPFAVWAAWILLGEALTPLQIAGSAIVIAGIVLVKLGEDQPAA